MMVDPGRPFSRPYRDLIEELEDQIRYGVEQIENLRLVFSRNVNTYELPPNADVKPTTTNPPGAERNATVTSMAMRETPDSVYLPCRHRTLPGYVAYSWLRSWIS